MKKKKIILITILILFLLFAFVIIDHIIPIEKPLPTVDYTISNLIKAYHIEEDQDSIILTAYAEWPLRQVTTYRFSNNILTSVTDERYYSSKLSAMLNMKSELESHSDATRKGNMITYQSKNDESTDTSRSELMENLEKGYSQCPKI